MKRAVMRLFCLAAFAAALTGAVCCALNMRKMWANCAACSIAPSTGGELRCWTPCIRDRMDGLYPGRRVPVRNQRVPPHAQRSGAGASFLGDPGRIAFFPLVSGRLPPRRGERRVRPGRGVRMGAVSLHGGNRQPRPRKRRFPARGGRSRCGASAPDGPRRAGRAL